MGILAACFLLGESSTKSLNFGPFCDHGKPFLRYTFYTILNTGQSPSHSPDCVGIIPEVDGLQYTGLVAVGVEQTPYAPSLRDMERTIPTQ